MGRIMPVESPCSHSKGLVVILLLHLLDHLLHPMLIQKVIVMATKQKMVAVPKKIARRNSVREKGSHDHQHPK